MRAGGRERGREKERDESVRV
jgi:hypothetical protein